MLVIYHYDVTNTECHGPIRAVSLFVGDQLMMKYQDTNCAARASGFIDALYACGFARDQPEYQARNDFED